MRLFLIPYLGLQFLGLIVFMIAMVLLILGNSLILDKVRNSSGEANKSRNAALAIVFEFLFIVWGGKSTQVKFTISVQI